MYFTSTYISHSYSHLHTPLLPTHSAPAHIPLLLPTYPVPAHVPCSYLCALLLPVCPVPVCMPCSYLYALFLPVRPASTCVPYFCPCALLLPMHPAPICILCSHIPLLPTIYHLLCTSHHLTAIHHPAVPCLLHIILLLVPC